MTSYLLQPTRNSRREWSDTTLSNMPVPCSRLWSISCHFVRSIVFYLDRAKLLDIAAPMRQTWSCSENCLFWTLWVAFQPHQCPLDSIDPALTLAYCKRIQKCLVADQVSSSSSAASVLLRGLLVRFFIVHAAVFSGGLHGSNSRFLLCSICSSLGGVYFFDNDLLRLQKPRQILRTI